MGLAVFGIAGATGARPCGGGPGCDGQCRRRDGQGQSHQDCLRACVPRI